MATVPQTKTVCLPALVHGKSLAAGPELLVRIEPVEIGFYESLVRQRPE